MKKKSKVLHLADFDVSQERGFLPDTDPLEQLVVPGKINNIWFECWDSTTQNLPKELASGSIRYTLRRLSDDYMKAGFGETNIASSLDNRMSEALMRTLSFLGHAWVWGSPGEKPIDRIPAGLAMPWYQVANKLGRPPILSYASYALYNWRRINPKGSIALGNIALVQNFLGGLDEDWFILIHVEIEAKTGIALSAIIKAQEAVRKDDIIELVKQLAAISSRLKDINETLNRMTGNCDPYIYYNRVRPYIHGWDNPALPRGVIYEGVKEYKGKPKKFRGETGAQSTIIPTLDAALGIGHKDDPLRPYLAEMRDYMPPKHRSFLEAVERAAKRGSSIRAYVKKQKRANTTLLDVYNSCVSWVETFRDTHVGYAKAYISTQAQKTAANPTGIGTGGTPHIPYLEKHRDETKEHKIK